MAEDNVVEYVMKDGDGNKHSLFYYLYHTPFISKWTELVKKNLSNPGHSIYQSLNNLTFEDLNKITTDLKECCTWLNKQGYGPKLPVYNKFNNTRLNELHEIFEQWGIVRDNKKDPHGIIESKWFSLNENIHQCEDVLTARNLNTYLNMGGLIDIHPLGLHNDLTEDDKLLLTTEFKWGELYLGYNTLGKDYLTIMQTNDIRAIDNDEVKPQTRYAAESWQFFGLDQLPVHCAQAFSMWYQTLPEATKKKIPLNDLTLGRIILGKLIPHMTPSCMDVDKNLLHWESAMHSCKDVWNKKYYSTFVDVTEIKFHQLIPDEVEKFVEENKQYAWRPNMEAQPKNLFESDWPWAPVDPFPNWNQRRVEEELEKVDSLFVPHRANDKIHSYSHEGWSSLTLHGISRDKTEHFDRYGFKTEEEANYHWIENIPCPYIIDLIKKLPFKSFSRVRIMKVAPGGYIMPHNDTPDGGDYKRLLGPMNIALTQPFNCDFVMEGAGILPFRPGKGFVLDVGHRHCIVNRSNKNRYHVIIHGEYNDNAKEIIR